MNTACQSNQQPMAKMFLFPAEGDNALPRFCPGENPAAENGGAEQQSGGGISKNTVIYRVTQILRECGVPANLSGYAFVRESIVREYYFPNYRNATTKSLYPDVAAVFHSTPSRVERSIRHAIEVAWARGNLDALQQLFGYTVSSARGKPTNSEFIATISDYLRLMYPV